MADVFNPNGTIYFGDEFFSNSAGTDNLNAAIQRWDGLFAPATSGNINNLPVCNWEIIVSGVSMTVELYADSGGNPTGTALTSGTFTPITQFIWNSVPCTTYAVTANTIYHIVVKFTGAPGTSQLNMRHITDTGGLISTTNRFGMRTSSNSGSSWSNPGSTIMGCVGMGFSDGHYEGMGYTDFDFNVATPSTGVERWGNEFTPAATTTIDKVAFWTKVNATPAGGDCTFYIYNKTDGVDITPSPNVLVPQASATTTFTLWEASLSSNVTLSSSKTYIVGINSPASGNGFYVNRMKNASNDSIGNAMTWYGTSGKQSGGPTGSTDSSHDIPMRLHIATVGGTITAYPAFLLNFM